MAEAQSLVRRPALPATGEAEVAADAAVGVQVLVPRTWLGLRLAPAEAGAVADGKGLGLDLAINRCRAEADRLCLRLGPDEWLLAGAEAEAAAMMRAVEAALAGRWHSLVDLSHGFVAFAVTGPAAAEAINAGCPLDLWPSVFRAGHATRTLLGKAEIILARPGDAEAFEIVAARSFAPYVRDFLAATARGLEVEDASRG